MMRWLHAQRAACGQALGRLMATPLGSLLALMAIGVILALPAGGWLMLKNAERLTRGAQPATAEITLFLAVDAPPTATDVLVQRLASHSQVRTYRRVPREETLARMQEQEGLREAIALLPSNPFSDAIVIVPRDERAPAMEALAEELRRWPQVAHVALDAGLVRKLDAFFHLGRIAASLLAALLALGLLAITFSTIRLQVLTQRAEIELARLLGATDAFIRRPFLWFGFGQGLLGAGLAWLTTAGASHLLADPLRELAALYGVQFTFAGLDGVETALLLASGALIGWLGAALSVQQHLRSE